MKKRGITPLAIVGVVVLVVGAVVFSYLYTSEEGKEEVKLTPEEQEKAETLGLTLEEFNETYTKAYESFIKDVPIYEGAERSEIARAIGYSKIEDFESLEHYLDIQDFEMKPSSKIILVEFAPMQPTPYLICLIENGEVKILVEELYPGGEMS